MRIYVDIDGTIADTRDMEYEHAKPRWSAIERVKSMHRRGHEVTMWTARGTIGSTSRRAELREMTRKQLARWGLTKGDGYDFLSVGEKPVYDVLYDDRAQPLADLVST